MVEEINILQHDFHLTQIRMPCYFILPQNNRFLHEFDRTKSMIWQGVNQNLLKLHG